MLGDIRHAQNSMQLGLRIHFMLKLFVWFAKYRTWSYALSLRAYKLQSISGHDY